MRAQAMCTLARVGLITPAAREAARRRQVAMRMEAQMKEERKAQWMEEDAVDSLPPGTCLAKERLMSWSLNKNKYFPKHTLYAFVSKLTKYFNVYHCVNVGKRTIPGKLRNSNYDIEGT